ncbi:MAG: GNAT family N-acetyltransferase [Pedobacter sp.]|nr:MAG: GNAT family N-acetyltransferase [Pedobacter sp.]
MDIIIKRVKENESNLVSALFNQYRIFYKQLSDIGMAKAFIEERLVNNESVIFVALNQETEKPVGFTQLYPIYSSRMMSKNWILNDLYVDEDHRQQGIGADLIKTVMQFAKMQGCSYVQLQTAVDNYSAQSLYESIGFEKQEEDKEFLLYKIKING